MLPNFVIIGAQKAGTTFVRNCLRDHPDVFMPSTETRFFEDPEYLRTDFSQFEALFRNVSHERTVGIKRPDYLAKPECPERIHRHIPQARLVAILRNPIERAISAYFHLMTYGFIPIRPLDEGMTRILDGEYKERYPKADEIIDYGFYYQHLMRYLQFFDKSQMLIVLFGAIRADPRRLMEQIYGFVGVDDRHVPKSLGMKDERNSGVYSLARIRFLASCNPLMYTYEDHRTSRHPRRRTLWRRAANRAVLWTDQRVLAPIYGKAKPQLSADLGRVLHGIYREDIDGLEDLLGQKLADWKSPEGSELSPRASRRA